MGLSGPDIELLSKKLAGVPPPGALNSADLEAFVLASLGDQLYVAYTSPLKPLLPQIRDLLNALENQGTTALFLRYVYFNRPGRIDVRDLIAQKCPEALAMTGAGDRDVPLSAQSGGTPQADAPTNALAPGFQRNIRPFLPTLDVRLWVEQLLQIERRVCRIEVADQALGTGFLVGSDSVLTNWHVTEQVKKSGQLAKLNCRFDYLKQSDGTIQSGQVVGLGADAEIDASPYSAAEKTGTPENPLPTLDELDYALLRLAKPVGTLSFNGVRRGWIALPRDPVPLPADAPLLIVQHPEGGPMKLALDTSSVIGRNANNTRIRYKTNTEPGSSGSPCFTIDWSVVALHHYGDPKWQNPLFNQGVPIELIRKRIEGNELGGVLGV